jgi:diguanylate cyclase (GGDEF)-like protein
MNSQISDNIKTALPHSARMKEWYRLGWLLPWLVLAISLVATYLVWQSEQQNAINDLQIDFDFRVREADTRIEQRMKAYEQILRGVKALFLSSDEVKHDEFHEYIDSLHLKDNYPGSHSIGFARVVPEARKTGHMRKEEVQPDATQSIAERKIKTSVTYLESLSGDNGLPLGSDLHADPIRRAAMEQARDTGQAVNSGKVLLPLNADENKRIQGGFLMFVPVYKKGAPHVTLAQRRANIIGWVYASFRMIDLMSDILGDISSEIDIEIHDGRIVDDATMIYDPDISGVGGNPDAQFKSRSLINIANREWTVVIRSLYGFEIRADKAKANFVAYVGLETGLLLAILAWLLVRGRARALKAAEIINHELNERKAAEKKLKHLAHHDVLTDLPNRALFSDRLHQGLAQAKRDKSHLAVVFIDLDKFKPINDTYGHETGDVLLKEVAQRLRKCVREADTVSRIGGDEFIVLLPTVETAQDAILVAEKMLNVLEQSFEIAGYSLNISGSIGIAVYPEHGSDEKTLTHSADVAMYYAKSSGRNNARLYQSDMKDASQ